MKLLITGGHLTPALAVIDYIRAHTQYRETQMQFAGRKYAVDSEKTVSLEYREITARNIPFIALQAGRLTRLMSVKTLTNLLKIPVGFIQSYLTLHHFRPDAVLSFGGYLALPVACAARFLNIPVYTHEQTISPGLATKIIGLFSKKIFYSFSETAHLFKSKKAVFTGNPVRDTVLKVYEKPFIITTDLPVIYVTGGSLGSHSINDHILTLLPHLVTDYRIIHQIGDVKEYDDYDKALRAKKKLPPALRDRYYPVRHFFDKEIGYVYASCSMVIARAGANTLFELIHLKKPAILIPLPWSAQKEQQKHAELFVRLGLGELFEQKQSSGELLEMIGRMQRRLIHYKRAFQSLPFQIQTNAAHTITKIIMEA